MKTATLLFAEGLKTICVILAAAVALTPASTFAQRAAAGAQAGATSGVVRPPQAPIVRAPAGVSRPTVATPALTRPIVTHPPDVNPLASLRAPVTAFRPIPLPSPRVVSYKRGAAPLQLLPTCTAPRLLVEG
jgi:hypothetical protein